LNLARGEFLNRFSIKIAAMFLLMIFLGNVFAQNKNDQEARKKARERQQLRQAQSYQRINKHENAIRILRVLYASNTGEVQYYQELLESYLQLNMLEDALQLIEQQKASVPPHPRYDIDYGHVLLKGGEKEEALRVWEKIIKTYSSDVGIYTMIASVMASNRMYDEAVEIYKRAYQNHPDKFYLLKTLSDFYQVRMQYYQALEYSLEYLRKAPKNYQTVIRQVLSFNLEEPAQVDSLYQLLLKESRKYPDVKELQLVTAKFFQKYQRFDEALQIYRKLEDEKTQGRYFIEYARAVKADSLYHLALNAYQEIINRYPNSKYLLAAYLGAARSNLEIAREKNDAVYARQAVEMIQKVQEQYPTHPDVAELSLLEGDIYRQFFFDVDRATEIYLGVAKKYNKDVEIRERAYVNAGESYILRGDLEKASSILNQVTASGEQARALYFLAKIAFYRGNYDEAQEHLNRIIQMEGLSGKTTNDALELISLLSFAQSAPEALKFYTEADLLLFQQKKSEAVNKLHSALKKPAPPNFRSKMIFEAAHLSADLGEFAEALDYCNEVLQDEQMLLYADEALFMMANIVDYRLNDYTRAFSLYDRLLAEFPESQFAIPARERLKEIRKQNPNLVP
jgi:tetratricopeptide (TPR) repeat protein